MSIATQKEFGGINVYHDFGFYGQGINVMQMESSVSSHGLGTVKSMLDIAPQLNIYRTGISFISDSEIVKEANCFYEGVTYTIEEFIVKYKIKFITRSTGGKTVDPVKSAYWQNLIDKYNIILVSPAGNESSDGVTTAFPDAVSIIVGGVGFSDSKVVNTKWYTGKGKEVDFAYFTGDLEGTSFAAPRLLAVMALLCNRFGDLTRDEMIELLRVLSVDTDVSGVDYATGWGVPVLHANDNLIFEGDELITATRIKVDGVEKIVKRILKNGENYIRLRDFEDVLGVVDIEYDEINKLPVVVD